ncbi:MAG TPA: hypothetical protein VIS74_02425 [Chthoniobacterales bacterium]
MNPWLGIGGVIVLLGILMRLVQWAQKRGLPPELSRKSVHIGMGLICAAFPWIFSNVWPVGLLSILAVSLLGGIRLLPALREKYGAVLGGVKRTSLGEIYFPIAIALTFWLAEGDRLLFVIPVLILTFADAVGALVGIRYGLSRYRTDEGQKSAEGSLAFFTVAFLTAHIPLLLFTTIGRSETLLIALTLGFLVMLLEAISWRGLDNFIIPLGAFFILKLYAGMTAADLLIRFAVLLALVALVILGRNRTTLSDSAVLAGALAGYLIWALAGWVWLVAPVILFGIYIALPSFPAEERPIQSLRAVTRVMFGGFVWLFLSELMKRPEWLLPFAVCFAAHAGNIIFARLRVVRTEIGFARSYAIALLGAFLPFSLICLAAGAGILIAAWGALFLAIAISVAIFSRGWTGPIIAENGFRLWLTETLVAPLASLIGLLPLLKIPS